MKKFLVFGHFLLAALCIGLFAVSFMGQRTSAGSAKDLLPTLRTIEGKYFDLKLRLQPDRKPPANIVIVGIDEASVEGIGRWPWSRYIMAYLLDKVAAAEPRAIGFDITFPEAEEAIPNDLVPVLRAKGLEDKITQYDFDTLFGKTVLVYRDQVVLGWFSEDFCPPYELGTDQCALDPQMAAPKELNRFSIVEGKASESLQYTNIVTSNITKIQQGAKRLGFFITGTDPDGVIRRPPLLLSVGDKLHSSLGLTVAATGLDEKFELLPAEGFFDEPKLVFKKSKREIPLRPDGSLWINFGTKGYEFRYLSAIDIIERPEDFAAALKGAYVFLGATATGINDIRNFPLDSAVPGVEGHAWLVENILQNQTLRSGGPVANLGIGLFMLLMGLCFMGLSHRLDSRALLVSTSVLFGLMFVTDYFLFQKLIHLEMVYAYLQLFALGGTTVLVKYISEEKEKRFLKGAFSRYVSPKIVQEIVDDPERLTLGGEKKELTIFFSDIRSFTTISEKFDPITLSKLLNEYFTECTKILVEEYDATLDKFIGDAIMTFWNAPISQPDHSYRGLMAAKKMARMLREKNAYFKEKYGCEVKTGMGLHTGEANVGNLGSQQSFNYSVIGDAVNLAARLEGLTKFYGAEVIVSKHALEQALKFDGGDLTYRILDKVQVKGKTEGVEIAEIIIDDLSSEPLRLYEEARKLFMQRKFNEALLAFKGANGLWQKELNRDDAASSQYIKRCEEFLKNPPPENWNGNLEMRSK